MMSRLENLPNEILLYIFTLIPWYDLIHSKISSLNSRLRRIINDIPAHLIQLDRLTKTEFDEISVQLYPSNIYSISLSNAIIFDQIKRFFSMIDIKKLKRLQSLTLEQPTELDLTKILSRLSCLPQLNTLKIDTDFEDIAWRILTMQNSDSSQLNTTLSTLTIINSSWTDSYRDFTASYEALFNLFLTYPFLKYLNIHLVRFSTMYVNSISLTAYQLKYLSITSYRFMLDEVIIKHIPNVHHLSCTVRYVGRQELLGSYLEHLLSSLNKLETLNLFLSYHLDGSETDNFVDEVKLSYETNFWLVNHEWYVNIQQSTGTESTFIQYHFHLQHSRLILNKIHTH
jgi:hypothetical protein